MLRVYVQSMFASYNLRQYDLSSFHSLNLPQSLMDYVEQLYSAEPVESDNPKLRASFDFGSSDASGWASISTNTDNESESPTNSESPLFTRIDKYSIAEKKAINQYGFFYPDYCVCLRPNRKQEDKVC